MGKQIREPSKHYGYRDRLGEREGDGRDSGGGPDWVALSWAWIMDRMRGEKVEEEEVTSSISEQEKKAFEAHVAWELYQLKFRSRITTYFTGERIKKAEVLFRTCPDWETLQAEVGELGKGYKERVKRHYDEYDDLPAPPKPYPVDSDTKARARERAQAIFDNDQEGYFEEGEDA